MTASPLNVLVVGGGVAGLEALLALNDLAGDRVALTLLSPTREYVHRAMAVAETFSLGRAPRVPLARVASDTGAELVEGKLAEVRPDERRVALVDGRELGYDALLLAVGGPSVPAVPHAMTWTPEAAPELLGGLLRDLEEGYGTHGVAFIVPSGVAWALPAYELALMTARQVQGMGQHPPLFLLTPEPAPLAVFGTAASEAVAAELDAVGIAVRTHAADVELEHSDPLTAIIEPAHERLSLSRAVALPRQLGPGLAGLPADTRGFLRTDRLMRVEGVDRVWAAGDGADYPVKQGGLAAQQADVAAQGIAALAGIDLDPQPFRPLLRGRLMTGRHARWIPIGVPGGESLGDAAARALWWPPAKVAARYLAPYLVNLEGPAELDREPEGGTAVEVTLSDEGTPESS